MEKKYEYDTQIQVDKLMKKLGIWKDLFSVKINFYVEGWAAYLMEKNIYPRLIVIFKPYDCDYFSIKSFEVSYDTKANEIHSEIYSQDLIYGFQNLFVELKEVIYGKDIITSISTEIIDTNNSDEIR
ncbi:MAG: hypothetical protein MUP85_05845 [Candidatus Lokiarchaeota archaeon]|nr:hypothetical protein [Candidatus Lokiarchaeota archaeon]